MSFLLPLFVSSAASYGQQKIAVGIWAGKETISNRVKAQAQTWMRFWDDVFVFTDGVEDSEVKMLNDAAFPCKVHCVVLNNLSEHLEQTEWTNRWYFAQPRFLPAMAELYERNPHSDWFLFGDDDTYFFRQPIEAKAKQYNESSDYVIGKLWCTWERITQLIPPKRNCHPFAQGGAGVLISKGMMSKIGSKLRDCSRMFNDPDFAGSMRFAICAERTVGVEQWDFDRVAIAWLKGFHSSPPDFEIGDQKVTGAPASFHRIKPDFFPVLSWAHTVNAVGYDGSKVLADFSEYALVPVSIRIGSEEVLLEWRFGYWLSLPGAVTPLARAATGWTGYVNQENKLVSMYQLYQSSVNITCICQEGLKKPVFSHFADAVGRNPVVYLSCEDVSVVHAK